MSPQDAANQQNEPAWRGLFDKNKAATTERRFAFGRWPQGSTKIIETMAEDYGVKLVWEAYGTEGWFFKTVAGRFAVKGDAQNTQAFANRFKSIRIS